MFTNIYFTLKFNSCNEILYLHGKNKTSLLKLKIVFYIQALYIKHCIYVHYVFFKYLHWFWLEQVLSAEVLQKYVYIINIFSRQVILENFPPSTEKTRP